MNIPAIAVISIVSVVFIIALKLRAPIGPLFVFCALLLGLLAGTPFIETIREIFLFLISRESIELVVIVYLLYVMALVISKIGWLTRTVEALHIIIPNVRISAVMPASIIGLLPMPGGAMLSAPLVKEGARNLDASPERLTFLNYWFRHMWEYVWPLYPGIILSTALLKIPAGKLVASMWELTVVSIAIGLIVGMRKLNEKQQCDRSSMNKAKALLTLLKLTWYVWAVVVFVLILGFSILPVVACSTLVMLFLFKKPDRERLSLLVKAFSWKVLSMVAGVVVFKGILESSGSLTRLTIELSAVPQSLLLFAVPFAVGLLTGVNAAFVGLGFPLLIPFLVRDGNLISGNFALSYGTGFVGVLLSPVHLCLLLTKQYYGAKWAGIYKFLIPSTAVVLITAISIFIISRW